MYDIDALEASWKRYRKKRLMNYASGLGVVALVVGSGVFYWGSGDGARPESKKLNRASHASAPKTSSNDSTPQPKAVAVTGSNESKSGLAPSVPSLSTKEPSDVQPSKPKMTIVVSDREGKTVTTREVSTSRVKLEVSELKSKEVVRQIEERFRVTRDYDDAIYLAKYYYNKRQYKKAEYWAMQANTIDSTQEESWMIFGRAKAKRGLRADALKVLQAYYDRSGSVRVKDLIDRIRKGKSY